MKFSLYKETCLKAIETSSTFAELINHIKNTLNYKYRFDIGDDIWIVHDGSDVITTWIVPYKRLGCIGYWFFQAEFFCFKQNTWQQQHNFELSKIRFKNHLEDIENVYWESRKRKLLNAMYPKQWWNPWRSAFRKKNIKYLT